MPNRLETTHTMETPESRAQIARTMTILLGIYFAAGGALKLSTPHLFATAFAHWGYPAWALYAIGALELTAGLLVMAPPTAGVGGFLLASNMIGAVCTHIAAGEWSAIFLPLALGIGAALVAWHYAPERFKDALQRVGTSRPLVD